MDLRKLNFFQAVVTSGSFKRAAGQCNVSPPALTKGIQSLEQELGVSLFDRRRGKPSLTSAGELLLERARRILDEAHEIRIDMQRERRLETGEIRIGCGPIVMHSIIGRALARFSSLHPGIRVKVASGNWENLTQRLEDYSLDLVAADIGDAGSREEFHVTDILTEPLVWVAASSHPLSAKKQISFQDLASFPLAIPTAPAHMIRHLERQVDSPWLGQLSRPSIQCDNYTALINAVRRSRCLTALPASLASYVVDGDDLRVLDVLDWGLSSRAGIITLVNRAPSLARDAMERAIIEVSREIDRENRQVA